VRVLFIFPRVLNFLDLTNIVVRVSDGTDAGKEHALLLNSHLDSTLPSPGAADDAISVGIMLDCIRVLVDTPGWSPTNAVIFCASQAPPDPRVYLHLAQCLTTLRNRFRTAPTFSRHNTQSHIRELALFSFVTRLLTTADSVRAVINLEGIFLCLLFDQS
jgi:hypothetical protein